MKLLKIAGIIAAIWVAFLLFSIGTFAHVARYWRLYLVLFLILASIWTYKYIREQAEREHWEAEQRAAEEAQSATPKRPRKTTTRKPKSK